MRLAPRGNTVSKRLVPIFKIPPTPFGKGGRTDGLAGGHALEDYLGFFVDVVIVVRGTTPEWAGNDGGQTGALLSRKLPCRFMKIALSGCFNSEYTSPPFNNVEIQLENALLAQRRFQHPRNQKFFEFSYGISRGGKI